VLKLIAIHLRLHQIQDVRHRSQSRRSSSKLGGGCQPGCTPTGRGRGPTGPAQEPATTGAAAGAQPGNGPPGWSVTLARPRMRETGGSFLGR
jgi:hypothetical protein